MAEKRNRTPVLYVDDAGGHHKTALEAQAENILTDDVLQQILQEVKEKAPEGVPASSGAKA